MIPDDLADRLGFMYAALENELESAYVKRDGEVAASRDVPLWQAFAALVEEVGEVARALHDGGDDDAVRGELIQVATVAMFMAARPNYAR